ncbi:MAG: hypothetical protein KGM47_13590 [Acidobacteriota bacterium]|nr:hypothetical protein [Acidobacteriota bacterium]
MCRTVPSGFHCRSGFLKSALLAILVAVVSPATTFAWGREAHEMINAAAIRTLPQPLRGYFQSHQFYLVAHASDPDILAHENPGEQKHHFADVEAFDSYPFTRFRQQFVEERLPPTRRESENGDAMWQIERFTLRLAADFRTSNWTAANHDAVFAAHYAADLTQPLHTVLNYDGQKTGQEGIHKRFETGVVRYYSDRWTLQPSAAARIINLRKRIFDEFLKSYKASHAVFAADKEARKRFPYSSRGFLPAFCRLAGPLAESQIDDAANFVGSLWYTAWVRAGKPDLGGWKGR